MQNRGTILQSGASSRQNIMTLKVPEQNTRTLTHLTISLGPVFKFCLIEMFVETPKTKQT